MTTDSCNNHAEMLVSPSNIARVMPDTLENACKRLAYTKYNRLFM